MPAAVMQLISSLGVGGAERLLIDHVTAAAAWARPQVVVVMNTGESPAFRRDLEAAGAPVHFLGRTPGALNASTLRSLLDLKRRCGIGVVHSHNPGSLLWSCLLKTADPRIKLVHTLHGEGALADLCGARGRLLRPMIAGTVAVSPALETAARASGLRRVTRIDNGVALTRFSPTPRRESGGPLRIVCVGRLAPEKGQDILLEALALCAGAGLRFEARLVGDASAEQAGYRDRLKARAAAKDLAGRLVFDHGRTDIPEILREADLFVCPSRSEGFGLALVEAMASGLPVIAADIGGPGAILREHPDAGRLFTAGSPAALAARIQEFAADGPLRRALASAAPEAAAAYGIEAMAARHEAFYAAL